MLELLTEMTKEELDIYYKVEAEIKENKDKARRILNPNKLTGMVMHHKDQNLIKSDPVRYNQWNIEDLVLITSAEHTRLHHKGKTVSEEQRIACGNRFRGATPWNKGKTGLYKATEDTKKKMSEVHKGAIFTEEHKKKLGIAGRRRKGKVYANNGKINKIFFPDQIPDGWTKGKI